MQTNFFTRMEDVLGATSWFEFELLLLAIGLTILGIRLLIFVFDNLSIQSKLTTQLKRILQFILDHIEPFVILLVLGYFIDINYGLHVPLVILVAVGGYRQIRDYITGKALKYNGALVNGSFISIGEISGEVGDLKRLGVQIKSKDAIHFYSYTKLYDQGFTIHANDAFGGYYKLNIILDDEHDDIEALRSLVINSPYSDEFNDVRIDEQAGSSNEIQLSVYLRKNAHFDDLKELLRSKGYDCV